MNISRRQLFQQLLPTQTTQQTATPSDDLHLLQRISYSPRTQDVARMAEIGRAAYLAEQLEPQLIKNEPLVDEMSRLPIWQLDRAALYRLENSDWRVYEALVKGTVTHAVYSERQLLERVVDFWTDHFNVPANSFPADTLVLIRDAIRANAFGRFSDLLVAVSKTPAMLQYLDNVVNYKQHPNQNFARELLELHTLGVDGGYTEADVSTVARAFTGWTIHDRTRTGFYFDGNNHDTDRKQLLGISLPADRGIEDGLHVLMHLANHPSTAKHIATKLCVKFAADAPPTALVEAVTATFIATQGSISDVLTTLFTHPLFYQTKGQKLRRPFEFFVAAQRTTGTTVTEFWQLDEMLQTLGQVPHNWQPPNGFPAAAAPWHSAGGTLARWNVAMRLTQQAHGEMYNEGFVSVLHQRVQRPATVGELVEQLALLAFGDPLDDDARKPFIRYVNDQLSSDPATTLSRQRYARKMSALLGLMLASPRFQMI